MSTANTDSADLKAVTKGGLIREDVMNQIWDISKIPLPLTDIIGSETSKNAYKEWTVDALISPLVLPTALTTIVSNSRVDGSDAAARNDSVTGARVGNHHQISDKIVRISFRADNSDVIGRTKETSYQIMRRQQELRRDVEASITMNRASVADDGSSTAGVAGGLPTWLSTNTSMGASGVVGGFQSSGVTLKRTYGTARALSEAYVRDAVQAVFTNGGDPSIMMSVPSVIRRFSEYLFTSSARVATLYSDVGDKAEKATAMGSVNVFVTDFGTLKMIPNRLQLPYTGTAASTTDTYTVQGGAGTTADIFIIDPSYLALSYLKGYRTEDLARTGLSENKQMSVDWTLVCNTEKTHAIIGDILIASAAVA